MPTPFPGSSLPLLWLTLALGAVGCAVEPAPINDTGVTVTGDGSPGPGVFTLAFEDNFDRFDASQWQLMTHSWDGNLAQFSTSNTSFENGIASLKLTRAESDTVKPFRGVEMRSRATITYGKMETRARFAKGPGVVSAAVLIYTPWPADDWNELDIEYLSGPDKVQFNAMVYTGPPTVKPVTTAVSPTQYPMQVALDFDATADFHVYAVEWTPTNVRFLVDGIAKHEWHYLISSMKLPQNILLTIWASSAVGWAGAIGEDSAPTQADFDWIRVYDWKP